MTGRPPRLLKRWAVNPHAVYVKGGGKKIMEFNEPKNLLSPHIENQSACGNYQPIGTGDCWGCGHPFHEHRNNPLCVACCVQALTDLPAGVIVHTCKGIKP